MSIGEWLNPATITGPGQLFWAPLLALWDRESGKHIITVFRAEPYSRTDTFKRGKWGGPQLCVQ